MKTMIGQMEIAAAAESDYNRLTSYDLSYDRRKGFIEGAKWAIKKTVTSRDYIGREDINGVKIYTGDVCMRETTKEIGVIEYNPEILAFIFRRSNKTFIRLQVIINELEVIKIS